MDGPPPTSRGLLLWAADRYGDAEALAHGDRRVSFRGLLDASCRMAAALQVRGVRRGDRIGLWLPNWPEWVFARHALGVLGAVVVPINTRFKAAELAYCLQQGECKALLSAAQFLGIDFRSAVETVRSELRDLEWVAYLDELEAMREGAPLQPGDWPEISPDDVAYMIYTSGTTSFAKGVQLSHRNLSYNTIEAARAVSLSPGERMLVAIPLFSSFGTCHLSFAALSSGASMVLQDHFDPVAALAVIERERITYFPCVDTMVLAMAETPAVSGCDLSSLRRLMGAPLNPAAITAAQQVLRAPEVWTGYGLTEASAISGLNCASGPEDEALFRPLPGVEIRVVEPDTGRLQPLGREGEIQIRGGHVTRGYYRMPEQTSALFTDDHWMRTGDLGREEQPGLFRFLSRLKEVIKSGGFLVAPLEVEAVLGSHPAVAEACVVPRPDRRMGEVGVAFVQLKPGAAATADELLELCADRLANFKAPRQVIFVDEYPRTATGKIQRARLAERLPPG